MKLASGEAYQGPWRMNESDFRYLDAPAVDINNDGVIGIAWVDQSRKDIFFQAYRSDGNARLEEPVNVSRSPKVFSWLPRLVISEDGNRIYILWQEIVFSGGAHGGEIFFSRSNDGGKSFNQPLNLSNSIAGDGKGRLTARYWDNGSLDIIKGADDDLYVAWTEYEEKLWFSRSTDGGANFTAPLHAAGDNAFPARGPSIAVSNNGVVYLAWTVGEDPAANIHLTKSDDGGKIFLKPRAVLQSNGHCDAPKIAVDRRGTVHLVYAESPQGWFRRYHIPYTRSFDGGSTFGESRQIRGPAVEKFESMNFPSLSLDGEDNVYLVWELYPDHRNRPRGLAFAFSRDGGETFHLPSIVPGSSDPELGFNGSLQGLLMRKLAVNSEGEIAIVNNTFRAGEASHVWLFRGKVGN